MFIIIICFIIFFDFSFNLNNQIIISLASDHKSLKNIEKVIYSILNQNVDYSYYKIVLFLSKNEFDEKNQIPNFLKILEKSNYIRLIIIDYILNYQNILVYTIKNYPNNPILLIGNNIIFPYGWLDMFMNDHKKYPNDAISASIQYFFGKNLEIKEFIEGFKGEKFGIFNQVPDMIFNFAIINSELGGTLFPKNYFQNNMFYDTKLFLNISKDSHEFWESCFIMIENRILRQSSKIYDFTKYIINYNKNTNLEKKFIFEKIKSTFLISFPELKNIIECRQHKIIISFTSHPKRFNLLSNLLKSIKNQTLKITNIFLFLTEDEKKEYTLNISEFKIISVKENIKPHKKYYYAMQLFREYAIITIDDDIYYSPDAFESLYNSYLDYPNVISGRRSHYIQYRNNREIKNYMEWEFEQQYITNPDFNIFLTGNGGILYPPDILNINKNDLPLIYETLTTDDITLKYFSYRKGIACRWVRNNNINGILGLMPKTISLYSNNIKFNNDINIKKFKSIYQINVKPLCVSYKNIETGLTIYLFNMFNINNSNHRTIFNINAFSYCQIKKSMLFNIYFNNSEVYCYFDYLNEINKYPTNRLTTTCVSNSIIDNLNDYYFPKAQSENNDIDIKISNYRKHIRIIFKDFYCKESNNCILKAFFYKSVIKGYYSEIKINKNIYICKLNKAIKYININNFPIEGELKCKISLKNDTSKIMISGLPKKLWISENKNNNNIINIFILSKIILSQSTNNQIILIGKLLRNLNNELKNISIDFICPNFTYNCYVESVSREIQNYIYCLNNKEINSEILLENQVIFSENNKELLLLINEETFVEIDSNIIIDSEIRKYPGIHLRDINSHKNSKDLKKGINILDYYNIFFLILFSFFKYYFSLSYKKYKKLIY